MNFYNLETKSSYPILSYNVTSPFNLVHEIAVKFRFTVIL